MFNPIKRLAPLALLPWSAAADSPHFLGPLGWYESDRHMNWWFLIACIVMPFCCCRRLLLSLRNLLRVVNGSIPFCVISCNLKPTLHITKTNFRALYSSHESRAAYAAFVGFMGYAEGYMGFQTKFSPLVVARSAHLATSRPEAGLLGFLKWCAQLLVAPVRRREGQWSGGVLR